jgi:small subunit ribosomal protein S4
MARYRGSACKICRRARIKLFLKGERCFTVKCSIEKRPGVTPGLQPNRRMKKLSNYGVQLQEKQKLRKAYGVLEQQFRKYYEQARKHPVTGEALFQILESRFDNVVFRMGFGSSRSQARQFISHGHFQIDGKRASIPSIMIKPGAKISLKEGSKVQMRVQGNYVSAASRGIPEWLQVDGNTLEGVYTRIPSRSNIELDIQENLVVEYYSR